MENGHNRMLMNTLSQHASSSTDSIGIRDQHKLAAITKKMAEMHLSFKDGIHASPDSPSRHFLLSTNKYLVANCGGKTILEIPYELHLPLRMRMRLLITTQDDIAF